VWLECSDSGIFSSVKSNLAWIFAALLLMQTACAGGKRKFPRAEAPALADEERCLRAAENASPLLTEWPASEKAMLEAALRQGGVAVEYTGCEMRPITGCELRGSYQWNRTTLTTDARKIDDEDELFAKLPLGAFGLKAELARSGRLEVRTTVAGQFRLQGTEPRDVPDYGECARATHLLTAIAMGSFQLRAGASLDASAGVDAGKAGLGAGTRSSEEVLREAGNPKSCASTNEDAPHFDCNSPIQAFLVPLPRYARERGGSSVQASFSSASPKIRWEVRAGDEVVCETPCSTWLIPDQPYQLQGVDAPGAQTIELPDLSAYSEQGHVRVIAHGQKMGRLAAGTALAGSGGGIMFLGGFFALFGGLADSQGLLIGGAATAGVGAVMIIPGVILVSGTGARAEVTDSAR
jgi:hypothetical protein